MTGAGYAIFSPCRTWRYLLERRVAEEGPLFAYFGVNGSKADETSEDQTTRKWVEFTRRNGGRAYLAANPFALVSTDVKGLAAAADPIGPDNDAFLARALAEADILVPCWGSRLKLPEKLRPRLDDLRSRVFASGKPVKVFGFTASGDPRHPLMLGYDTPLQDWNEDIFNLV